MTIAEEIKILEESLASAVEPQEQAEIILNILPKYVRLRSAEGKPYTDQLLTIAATEGSVSYRAWALYYQALFLRYQDQFAAALELSLQAQNLFRSIDEQIGIANCYNNNGLIHDVFGNYSEALKNHLEALKIREAIGDKTGIANSNINISLIYYEQNNMEGALEKNLLALPIMKELGNKNGEANCYTNIGNIHFEKKNYDEALKYYLLCLEIERAVGNNTGLINAYTNMGSVYRSVEAYDRAMDNYVIAMELLKKSGSRQGEALVLNNMALIHYAWHDYKEALAQHVRALEISETIGFKQEAARACEYLTQVCEAMRDYKNALLYYNKYHQLDKEMLGQETQRQIAQLSFQHDLDLRERESKLLKEKNEEINIYARKLEVSNNSLNQFAHVASHDLREPLRMVTSYMQLLKQTMGDQINPMQQQFIGFAVDGAQRMEHLILDLLRLAKVDANPQIERVDIAAVIGEVRSNLEVLLKEKNAQILAADMPLIMADRTQVMQLFQNIIGNGIKYNESPAPTITIGYSKGDKEATLSIADNGIGIPPEYREKAFQIFKRLPTAKQYQGSGIGLAICKKIVDGLGGSIAIDDADGGGTVFEISVPVGVVCG